MSTRAVYTFIDEINTFHVYKHFDGYPSGALLAIKSAVELAWKGNRFEASEFSAAFVAANKKVEGGVYLSRGPESHGDLSYFYEIIHNGKELIIKCYDAEKKSFSLACALFFVGTMEELEKYAEENE